MPKGVERRKLYIGLDESNHGRYPEIIVAVSSLIKSDSVISRISGRERMTEDELTKFLRNEQRNYRYISAKKGELTRNRNPLVESAPSLIDELLKETERSASEPIEGIEIIFDGEVRSFEMYDLSNKLTKMRRMKEFPSAGLEFYPKSKKEAYDYPKLLIAADTLANLLFRRQSFIERIGAEERRIKFR